MKINAVRLLAFSTLLAIVCLASCQKPFHDENERYLFVASNISLPYWQEAQAGFTAAAHELGVKADFSGPESYAPDQ